MKVTKVLILVLGFLSFYSGLGHSSSLEELESLPYLGWSDKTVYAQAGQTRQSGVVKYNKIKAFDGYNFFYSDGGKNVYLMDMKGQIIYRWKLPGAGTSWGWGCVRLLNDGGIIAESVGRGCVKLDRNSKLIWETPLIAHHDIEVLPDGTLLVTAVEPHLIRYNNRDVIFDSIVHLSKDGKILDKWFAYDHLKELQKLHFPSLLDKNKKDGIDEAPLQYTVKGNKKIYEYYHLDSIQVLPDTALALKDRRFQKGNWLVCFRNVNLICILDRNTHRVVWSWGPGIMDGPHMPRMSNNGNILVYDNGYHRSYTRLIIIDPVSDKIVWEYEANPPESFYSKIGGSSQLLSNGDFLICECRNGRVFEITPSGEIVWEFFNPEVNKNGKRMTIYRMLRVSKEEVSGWLSYDHHRVH